MAVPPTRQADEVPPASPLVLLALIAVCLGVSAIGGAITASGIETWYPTLAKPPFTPPDWIIAPVWTTLCTVTGVAAWRVWSQRRRYAIRGPFILFGVQLLLNLLCSVLFFGLRNLSLTLAAVAVLLVLVLVTGIIFFRIDRLAGWLFAPYLGWTAFATLVMVQIWRLNMS